MTIQDLGALGELIGSVAVLATLVYLTLQTRQNSRMIGAQLDVARMNTMQTNVLTKATSSELLDAMAEDSIAESPINPRLSDYWMAEFFTHKSDTPAVDAPNHLQLPASSQLLSCRRRRRMDSACATPHLPGRRESADRAPQPGAARSEPCCRFRCHRAHRTSRLSVLRIPLP